MIAFVDIDGVLADARARRAKMEEAHHGSKIDAEAWDAFYEGIGKDKLIPTGHALVRGLYERGTTIIYLTGRREAVRQETVDWLKKHALWDIAEGLAMREHGDFRRGSAIKAELVAKEIAALRRNADEGINDHIPSVICIDDDPGIIAAYEALGLGITTILVGGHSDKLGNAP